MTLFGGARGSKASLTGKASPKSDLRRVQPCEDNGDTGSADKVTSASNAETDVSVVQLEPSAQIQRHGDRKRTSDEHGVLPRGARRHPSNMSAVSTESRRPAADNMAVLVQNQRKSMATLKPGTVVSKKNAKVNLLVVRNPKAWSYAEEDGGAGKLGMISSVDVVSETCTVYWYESGQVYDHYKIGIRRSELCKPTGNIPESLGGNDGLATPSMASSAMEAVRKLFGKRQAPEKAAEVRLPMAVERSPHRRSSQVQYADRTQTVIMFDWDDTLFPTTYLRHDLGLSVRKHLSEQNIRPEALSEVQNTFARAAGQVDQLLRLADKKGKVVIVTLAKSPWVTDSCKFFFPGVGELIERLGIKILYAQEGEQVEYSKVNMMAEEQFETFWAEMKGKAIARALEEFYSQYEGQSWKNIISIGDSDFERYGAMAATMEYARAQGLVTARDSTPSGRPGKTPSDQREPTGSANSQLSVADVKQQLSSNRRKSMWEGTINGQEFKVRTKTFKMLDDPTIEELMVELSLVQQWLPLMVKLNNGFDVDLNSLDDNDQIQRIDRTLRATEDVRE